MDLRYSCADGKAQDASCLLKGDCSGNPLRIEELTEVPPNRPKLHLLKEYCRKSQRVCPLPHYWHEMYLLIVGRGQRDLAPPLILAAWGLSDEEKSARFMLHLDYSVSNGTFTLIDEYLRGLSDDQWYCG